MSALEGIRVLDLGTFIAGPYCATILGEFGASKRRIALPTIFMLVGIAVVLLAVGLGADRSSRSVKTA